MIIALLITNICLSVASLTLPYFLAKRQIKKLFPKVSNNTLKKEIDGGFYEKNTDIAIR